MNFKKPNIYHFQPLKVEEPNSNEFKSLKVVKPNSVKFSLNNFVSDSELRQQDDKLQNPNKIIKSKQWISRNLTYIISSR